MEEQVREGRSLAETPTWAFATVITVMVTFGFFVQIAMKQFGKVILTTTMINLIVVVFCSFGSLCFDAFAWILKKKKKSGWTGLGGSLFLLL